MERQIVEKKEEVLGKTISVCDIPMGQIFKCNLAEGDYFVKNQYDTGLNSGYVVSSLSVPKRTWTNILTVGNYRPARKVEFNLTF